MIEFATSLDKEIEHPEGFVYENRDPFAFLSLQSTEKQVYECDICGELMEDMADIIQHLTYEKHSEEFRDFVVEQGGATGYDWRQETEEYSQKGESGE